MTFSDSLTPEESAYCFGLSCLKAASTEDLTKARVNPWRWAPESRREVSGCLCAAVCVTQSPLRPQLSPVTQKRGLGE